MKLEKIAILGAGTYGETLLTYLLEAGHEVLGFIDDHPDMEGAKVKGFPVLGKYEDLFNDDFKATIECIICSIGDNHVRVTYLSELVSQGYEAPNFVHDTVILTEDISMGKGIYILPGSIIMPHVILNDYCIISMGCKIAHHTVLHEGAFVSTGSNIGASIDIGGKTLMGIGCTIMTGVKKIGENAIIGAGSMVIRDVPDQAVVVGNPGRIVKYIETHSNTTPK